MLHLIMRQYSGVEAGTYTISKVEAGTRMIRVRSVDAEGNRSMGIQKNVEVNISPASCSIS